MTRPPISAASTRPPLRRATDDRLLLGVCAGIARSLDLAPLAVRLLFVALAAVTAPLTLGLYVVLAAIVPRDDGRVLLGGAPSDRRESLLGWSLVGLTLIWFTAAEFELGDLVWPALSSFGVFAAASSALALLALAQRREAMPGATATAAPPSAPPAAAAGPTSSAPVADDDAARSDAVITDERAAEGGDPEREPRDDGDGARATSAGGDAMSDDATLPDEDDAPSADLVPAGAAELAGAATAAGAAHGYTAIDGEAVTMQSTAPPRPPRRGPSLAVIGFGALLIGAAGIFLLDAVGQIDLTATGVAAALGVGAAAAGAGAIAATLTRRRGAVGLLVLGVVLGGACVSVAVLATELDDGIGVRTHRPATAADIPESYRLGAGQLTVDLSDTELPPGPTTVRADVALGELDVLVPPGVRVESTGPTYVSGVAFVNDALKPGKLPENERRAARERRARERAEAARPIVRIDADVREGDAEVIRVGG